MAEMNFVVTYDTDTEHFFVDIAAAQLHFPEGDVYDNISERWKRHDSDSIYLKEWQATKEWLLEGITATNENRERR